MCRENCCKNFSRVVIIIINSIFLLAGMLMLAFGIAIVVAPDKVLSIFGNVGVDIRIVPSDVVHAGGIFMIILGGIVGIIGMFGFFGACCENKCMLITYIVVMIIILLAEVALIIFAAVFPDKLQTYVQQGMNSTLITDFAKQDILVYNDTSINQPNDTISAAWATTQFEAGCCGVYGQQDYYNLPPQKRTVTYYGNTKILTVPLSCCALNKLGTIPNRKSDFKNLDGCVAGDTAAINSDNCYTAVSKLLNNYSKIAIGIAAGIVGLQIILIILSIILVVHIYKYGKSEIL